MAPESKKTNQPAATPKSDSVSGIIMGERPAGSEGRKDGGIIMGERPVSAVRLPKDGGIIMGERTPPAKGK